MRTIESVRSGGILLTAIAIVSAGCSSSSNQAARQQVWSTKSESVIGAPVDAPNSDISLRIAATPMNANPSALREPALSILRQAVGSPNPLLRANAIEALQASPEHLDEALRRSLGDANRGVRFVGAMTIGKLQMTEFVPLLEPLLHDESMSVQAAAMYGLRRCGRSIDLNPLAAMLVSEDAEAKGNAAYILGELGDPSAIPLLRSAAGKGVTRTMPARRKIIDLQIAEAMVKLGAVDEIQVIRAALFSTVEEGELAALACQMCGSLHDGGALPNLLDLAHRTGKRQQAAEVRLAAALAIAKIDPSRAPVDVALSYISNPRFELRAQAAMALGGMVGAEGQQTRVASGLSKLMNDSNAMVQVAAASGALRNTPSELAAR